MSDYKLPPKPRVIGKKQRVAVVVSRFNSAFTDSLVEHTLSELIHMHPDALIDLKVWKHWREPEYAACTEKEPWECFWRAIYSLVPRKEFVRHEWSEQHVYDWTTEKFVITWGAASSPLVWAWSANRHRRMRKRHRQSA